MTNILLINTNCFIHKYGTPHWLHIEGYVRLKNQDSPH